MRENPPPKSDSVLAFSRNRALSQAIAQRAHSVHDLADLATEALIYFLVLFTPWAFGTTEPWSISVLNTSGYLLGALLLLKWLARRALALLGFAKDAHSISTATVLLGWTTVFILAYCAISAANARATYDANQFKLEYHSCISWLPHSYEKTSSWIAFWHYLALALIFWAVRGWLLNETPGEPVPAAPKRVQRLLWILSLNGAALSLECLLQRMDGTNKLLWLVEPQINKDSTSQFGPYAYRANAAEYLNLLWPASLGLWWSLRRLSVRVGHFASVARPRADGLLLCCAVLMAAGAIASLSRGGVLIAVGQMGAVSAVLWIATRARQRGLIAALAAGFIGLGGLAAYFDWEKLRGRFDSNPTNPLSGRTEIYEHALRMARDFGFLGSGPHTFGPLYGFYFSSPDQYWVAQVHNDWLETWITFGALGMAFILFALSLVFWRSVFARDGFETRWSFVALIWTGLLGCLIHAMFDFPLQVPSILFLFLLLCAITSVLKVRHGRSKGAPSPASINR